jgi:hypothetical protein
MIKVTQLILWTLDPGETGSGVFFYSGKVFEPEA